VACKGETRVAYVGKTEGKRLLVRSRSRWENNIEIYVRDIGRMGVEWIDLAQGRENKGLIFIR
jgi:hypothetical protein